MWQFLGDARGLQRANREARTTLGQTRTEVGKGQRAWQGLNRTLGGFAAAIGVAAVGRFAVESAQMASAAERAGQSAEKVLGAALDDLHANLEDVRGQLGLNIGELDATVARFGLLTEGFGLTDQAQADFIEKLIVTGGELAAFRGNAADAPEAIDALGAAIRGEFDPLEQFGVKLSEAAIQERILALRADPANAELSDQELYIKAIQELIDEKAAKAVGSLAESEGDLASKTNEATTKLGDLQIALGTKMVPVFVEVLDLLLLIIDKLEQLPKSIENLINDPVNTRLGNWAQNLVSNVSRALGIGDLAGGGSSSVLEHRAAELRSNAAGGQVPGPKGAPSLAVVHGGETIQPYASANGGGGITINVTAGVGNPAEIARTVVEALQVYERTNGALPITVRASEN